jgi:hypothetical protein
MITEKKCSGCGEVKPVEEFYKRPSRKNGFTSECRKCARARNKAYIQSEKGQAHERVESRKSSQRKYRQSEKGKQRYMRYSQSEKGKATSAWVSFRRRDLISDHRRRRYQLKKLGPNFKPVYDQPINYTATSFVGDI